jgi:CheY-like chemotaxis protein
MYRIEYGFFWGGMSAANKPHRTWQEIATELGKEHNPARLNVLAQELDEALKREDCIIGETLSKYLLLVDDEDAIRVTLAAILRKYGFAVEVAASVPEAIQKTQKYHFDVLLSDLNISQAGDGFAVVRAFRQFCPEGAAVILTGYPGLESAVEGIHEKIDDYLVKPIEPDLLVSIIERQLAERAGAASGQSSVRYPE